MATLRMLTWLIALPCLVFASRTPKVTESIAQVALPKETWRIIMSYIGFANLYQASFVSGDFQAAAVETSQALYGIRYAGKVYPNYSAIIYELNALLKGAGKGGSIAEAIMALRTSPQLLYIRSVLEAEFGYCIEYSKRRLPKFDLDNIHFDILNDQRKITVLPYTLDQMTRGSHWTGFIRGLIEHGRLDLLSQLTFQKINSKYFESLESIVLPEAVLLKAAESVKKNQPALALSRLLASAGFGRPMIPLPGHINVPLFIFRHLCEKQLPIPESCVLTLGLSEAAIPFWMYVLGIKVTEGKVLLRYVAAHGDEKVKILGKGIVIGGGDQCAFVALREGCVSGSAY